MPVARSAPGRAKRAISNQATVHQMTPNFQDIVSSHIEAICSCNNFQIMSRTMKSVTEPFKSSIFVWFSREKPDTFEPVPFKKKPVTRAGWLFE